MKVILAATALTIWSFAFFGGSCGSANVHTAAPTEAKPASTPYLNSVKLTNEKPKASVSLDPDLASLPPKQLEVVVTNVVNPGARAVTIFVYFLPVGEKKDSEKIDVGNFSLFPADKPGNFMLDPAPAIRKLAETRKPNQEWQLVFELQTDDKSSTPLEITVAEAKWPRDRP